MRKRKPLVLADKRFEMVFPLRLICRRNRAAGISTARLAPVAGHHRAVPPATLAKGNGALKMAYGKYIFTVTFGEDAITVLAVVDESGVADVAVEADAAVEYYTLQGVRLNSEPTAAGIYVRRAGQKASKVAIF